MGWWYELPIAYIQIYNAYDFVRSTSLVGLPATLAAFDVLIGEETYLKQGIGLQTIAQFFQEHGNAYTHVFADLESSNLAVREAFVYDGWPIDAFIHDMDTLHYFF